MYRSNILYLDGCMYSFICVYIYGDIDRKVRLDVDILRQSHHICILKHTLPVPDIIIISLQIPYYTNIRKLCCYFNMFNSIVLLRGLGKRPITSYNAIWWIYTP